MFLVVFAFFNFSFAASHNPNPSSEAVAAEIQRHKDSVMEMAIVILQRFPEQFPYLSSLPENIGVQLLIKYINLHDAPKLWTMDRLRSAGYKATSTPFENIKKNWARPLIDEDRIWINELNEIEGEYKTNGLIRICKEFGFNLFDPLWRELLLIEDLADVFDTKLHRNFEVNGLTTPPKPFASEKYMRAVRKNELGARLLERLEIFWPMRTKTCAPMFN